MAYIQATKELASKIPTRIKFGLQIVAVIVLGIVVYKISKRTDQFFEDSDNRDETQSGANELEVLNKNPSTRQKISNAQAQTYANKLFTSMDGLGTYEEEILTVFRKLSNNADFLAVQKAFGIRTISSGSFALSDFRGTMVSCITDEVSTYWTKRINDILRSKKIKYRV